MADPTLSKIGKYEVVEVLGKGGMGVVYKAMGPAIGRLVAIKMMTSGFAENPDLLQREKGNRGPSTARSVRPSQGAASVALRSG